MDSNNRPDQNGQTLDTGPVRGPNRLENPPIQDPCNQMDLMGYLTHLYKYEESLRFVGTYIPTHSYHRDWPSYIRVNPYMDTTVEVRQYVNAAIYYYSLEEDSRRLFPATGQAIFLQRQTLMEEYHARYARPAYNETHFQLRRRYYATLNALRESNQVYLHILDRARTVRRDRQEQTDREGHDPLLDVDSVLDRFSDTDESFDD